MPDPNLQQHLAAARRVVAELGLAEVDAPVRAPSGHNSSVILPCRGDGDQPFLLKYFVPPTDGAFYPQEVRLEDYARRESAFYRLLDSIDPDRRLLPAPRTILIDARDPPAWLLLERIQFAKGPPEEVLGMDHVFELVDNMRQIPPDSLLGRRDFPLNRWDPISYLDRVRMMYEPVLFVIGERRWTRVMAFYTEALRWTEPRPHVFVHGDFTEQNLLIDEDGRPFLLDFERVGAGNLDHDFAWFWIHAERPSEWKRRLVERYLSRSVGSTRIAAEWGIRSTVVYLALRRLRFGYLKHGDEDALAAANLALLDAALAGGRELFPS